MQENAEGKERGAGGRETPLGSGAGQTLQRIVPSGDSAAVQSLFLIAIGARLESTPHI